MITTLQKWGNSKGIRIPKSMLDSLGWDSNGDLLVTTHDNKIIIEQADRRKSIQELFAGYDGDYVPEETDWGAPAGREIW